MKSNSKIFTAIATALLLAPSVEAGPKKPLRRSHGIRSTGASPRRSEPSLWHRR